MYGTLLRSAADEREVKIIALCEQGCPHCVGLKLSSDLCKLQFYDLVCPEINTEMGSPKCPPHSPTIILKPPEVVFALPSHYTSLLGEAQGSFVTCSSQSSNKPNCGNL